VSDSQWIGLISTVAVALLATVTQIMLSRFKRSAEQEIEHLRDDLRRIQESAKLRRQYSTPFLKASEDLYNKLNDIVSNRHRVLSYLEGLPSTINSLSSVGDILRSPKATYLTSMLYQFARFWASIEAIKKDFGVIELASQTETKALHARIRQTVAVFPSGRLHRGLNINSENRLKYEGRILGGAQVLIAESILAKDRQASECISYYEFCQKLVTDKDFRESLSPLIDLLGDLKEATSIDSTTKSLDFRWAKIIVFGSVLRDLIEVLDGARIVSLLPEFKDYEEKYLNANQTLKQNLLYFKEAYPDP
jgi:hypothetical protein